MASVILYFGSFNPVHEGHMAIAEYVLRENVADELWFVVSPHNPLKDSGGLIDEEDRLVMVRLAISQSPLCRRMKVCDIEFDMPRPSYTIDTLQTLERLFPDSNFSLLIGSDNVEGFDRWKDWRKLVNNYKIYVYPRRGYRMDSIPEKYEGKFNILARAPYFDFSSTQIRSVLTAGNDVQDMLPWKVYDYIKIHGLWNVE